MMTLDDSGSWVEYEPYVPSEDPSALERVGDYQYEAIESPDDAPVDLDAMGLLDRGEITLDQYLARIGYGPFEGGDSNTQVDPRIAQEEPVAQETSQPIQGGLNKLLWNIKQSQASGDGQTGARASWGANPNTVSTDAGAPAQTGVTADPSMLTPKAGDAGFLTSIKETLAKITPDKDTQSVLKTLAPFLVGAIKGKASYDDAEFTRNMKLRQYNDDLARRDRINRSSVATPALKTVTRRVK